MGLSGNGGKVGVLGPIGKWLPSRNGPLEGTSMNRQRTGTGRSGAGPGSEELSKDPKDDPGWVRLPMGRIRVGNIFVIYYLILEQNSMQCTHKGVDLYQNKGQYDIYSNTRIF